MPTPSNNLLLRLHKWAWRQDENFLTEAFAHLLQHLVENEPEASVELLLQLTKNFLKIRVEDVRFVEIRTQIVETEGRPDIELRSGKQQVYIEVKVESEPGPGQMLRYRRLLSQSAAESTFLILLSRYPVEFGPGEEAPDLPLRWYELADWLQDLRYRYTFRAVSAHLVDQFLSFLGARNMTMAQVTWELSGGIKALKSLADMLYETATACGLPALLKGDRDSMGVYIDAKSYWLGIEYKEPRQLSFTTWNLTVDRDKAAQLGIEGVYEWKEGSQVYHLWERLLDLESEEVHFFARSKASQRQFLEEHLRECLGAVRQIEIRDTTPRSQRQEEQDSGEVE